MEELFSLAGQLKRPEIMGAGRYLTDDEVMFLEASLLGKQPPKRWGRLLLVSAVVVMVLAIVGYFFYHKYRKRSKRIEHEIVGVHNKHDVFISYSRKDNKIVQSVVGSLREAGYSCWMDVDGIESSDRFKRVLVRAIKESKIVLFFSSVNSNSSEWIVKEIDIAVEFNKPILPILLDDAPYDDSIMFDLKGLDYVLYQDGCSRSIGFEKLLRSLKAKIGQGESTAHVVENAEGANVHR